MSMSIRRRLSFAVAVVALAATGCSASSGSTPGAGPYSAEIKAAAKQATSDFERGVLSDGVITRAEYQEAIQRYVDCGKQHGLDIGLIDQGGWYTYSMPTVRADDPAEFACNKGTVMLIASLYEQFVKNPNKQDIDEVEFNCLVRLKVAPSGYSLQQYKQDKKTEQSDSGFSFTTGSFGAGAMQNGSSSSVSPYPFDNTSLGYGACINNPADPKIN